jgi:hypothetical protein
MRKTKNRLSLKRSLESASAKKVYRLMLELAAKTRAWHKTLPKTLPKKLGFFRQNFRSALKALDKSKHSVRRYAKSLINQRKTSWTSGKP